MAKTLSPGTCTIWGFVHGGPVVVEGTAYYIIQNRGRPTLRVRAELVERQHDLCKAQPADLAEQLVDILSQVCTDCEKAALVTKDAQRIRRWEMRHLEEIIAQHMRHARPEALR